MSADPQRHRLTHLHANAPGVLASINGILGDHGVNIEAQSLATKGQLGYVITDISAEVGEDVLGEFATLPESVRLRQIS